MGEGRSTGILSVFCESAGSGESLRDKMEHIRSRDRVPHLSISNLSRP
jgi:hypothetical protein